MELKYTERICEDINRVECLTRFMPCSKSPVDVFTANFGVKGTSKMTFNFASSRHELPTGTADVGKSRSFLKCALQ